MFKQTDSSSFVKGEIYNLNPYTVYGFSYPSRCAHLWVLKNKARMWITMGHKIYKVPSLEISNVLQGKLSILKYVLYGYHSWLLKGDEVR